MNTYIINLRQEFKTRAYDPRNPPEGDLSSLNGKHMPSFRSLYREYGDVSRPSLPVDGLLVLLHLRLEQSQVSPTVVEQVPLERDPAVNASSNLAFSQPLAGSRKYL